MMTLKNRYGRITAEMNERLHYVQMRKEYSYDEKRNEMLCFIARYYKNQSNFSTEDLVKRYRYLNEYSQRCQWADNAILIGMLTGIGAGIELYFLNMTLQLGRSAVFYGVVSLLCLIAVLLVAYACTRYAIGNYLQKQPFDPYCTNPQELKLIGKMLREIDEKVIN